MDVANASNKKVECDPRVNELTGTTVVYVLAAVFVRNVESDREGRKLEVSERQRRGAPLA